MPPEPHGAAAAGRQRGESADGRARRAWVDRDGSRSATLGELLTVKLETFKNGEGVRGRRCPGTQRGRAGDVAANTIG